LGEDRVLLSCAKIDVPTKLDAQRVEVGVSLFHGGAVNAVEERDLQGRQPVQIGKQIPRLAAAAGKRGVAQVRAGNHLELAHMRIGLGFGLVGRGGLVEIDRLHQLLGDHLQGDGHQQRT